MLKLFKSSHGTELSSAGESSSRHTFRLSGCQSMSIHHLPGMQLRVLYFSLAVVIVYACTKCLLSTLAARLIL